ncbi:MAG: bifunctional diguanylate cyclase/phosphodiesterase [Pseudomonadota bacterium]
MQDAKSSTKLSLDETNDALDASEVRTAALVSLLSPILIMASMVSVVILGITNSDQNLEALRFWLYAHCLVCALFFLVSLREKSILFDQAVVHEQSLFKNASIVILGFLWGGAPGLLILLTQSSPHTAFGSVLAGFTFAAAILLRYLPRLSAFLLTLVGVGFGVNTLLQPTPFFTVLAVVMFAYFSVLGVCTRWYYARFSRRLDRVEIAAEAMRNDLKSVDQSKDMLRWSTNAQGKLIAISDDGRFQRCETYKPTTLVSIFEECPDKSVVRSNMRAHDLLEALELKAVDANGDVTWWRLSGQAIAKGGVFDGYRGTLTEITRQKTYEKEAAYLATHDALTGLPNRAAFLLDLAARLDKGPVDDHWDALVRIDIDQFKWINDTFGHAGGDAVLQHVSEALSTGSQSTDLVCRFGGDEFIMLLRRAVPDEDLEAVVKSLSDAVSVPFQLESVEVHCTASIGYRRILSADRDIETILHETDLALYAAKQAGRDACKEFSESFKAETVRNRQLAKDLERAIANSELELHFQPIVSGRHQSITGCEALLRWDHPEKGRISPTEFVPIAEDTGLIVRIGEQVISKALEAAAELPDDIKVAINVSPLQLHSKDLVAHLEDQLLVYGVDASRIELEITESVFISENAFILNRLKALKALGVRIALDDFGTGFSSLSYLQRFPFDKLKLDQAFVAGLETSRQSRAIVSATISMAHALDLQVTAEGIETEIQAAFLVSRGCDELQGYYFSKPGAIEHLKSALEDTEFAPSSSDISLVPFPKSLGNYG